MGRVVSGAGAGASGGGGFTVQRGTAAVMVPNNYFNAQHDVTIPAVDPARTQVMTGLGNFGSQNGLPVVISAELIDSVTLRLHVNNVYPLDSVYPVLWQTVESQ